MNLTIPYLLMDVTLLVEGEISRHVRFPDAADSLEASARQLYGKGSILKPRLLSILVARYSNACN